MSERNSHPAIDSVVIASREWSLRAKEGTIIRLVSATLDGQLTETRLTSMLILTMT